MDRLQRAKIRPLGFNAVPRLAVIIAAIAFCGCGGTVNPVPPAADAKTALESALTAWKKGKPASALEGATPSIHVADSVWQGGRGLKAFEIVGESPSQGNRSFQVKLSLAKPDVSQDAVYIVLGTDALWVYRSEDYERTMNMDNNPAPAKRGRR